MDAFPLIGQWHEVKDGSGAITAKAVGWGKDEEKKRIDHCPAEAGVEGPGGDEAVSGEATDFTRERVLT